MEEPTVHTDEGGSGAGDGVGKGGGIEGVAAVAGATVAASALVEGACEHASSSSHTGRIERKFEAGGRTGSSKEKGEGQQQRRHLRPARQRPWHARGKRRA